MANTLTAFEQTVTNKVYTKLEDAAFSFERIGRFSHKTEHFFKVVDLSGGGTFTDYSALSAVSGAVDLASQDLAASAYTAENKLFSLVYSYTEEDLLNDPEMPEALAQLITDDAVNKINDLFWDTFAGLPNLDHPDTLYAAGKKYIDSFANGNKNQLTVALSDSGLASALNAHQSYLRKNGSPLAPSADLSNYALVVPGALMTTARKLANVGSQYDGNGISNDFRGMDMIVAPWLGDSNDWALVYKVPHLQPVGINLRSAIKIKAFERPRAPVVDVRCSFQACAVVNPFEGGIIYSVVS